MRKATHSHRLADAAYRALVKRARSSNATSQASGVTSVIAPIRAERFYVAEVPTSPVMVNTAMVTPATEQATAPDVVMENALVEEHSADYSRVEESPVLTCTRLAKDLSKVNNAVMGAEVDVFETCLLSDTVGELAPVKLDVIKPAAKNDICRMVDNLKETSSFPNCTLTAFDIDNYIYVIKGIVNAKIASGQVIQFTDHLSSMWTTEVPVKAWPVFLND